MTDDSDWRETLIAQLDKDQSLWFIDWASQDDLRDFVYAVAKAGRAIEVQVQMLKHRVSNRMFHRIINASLSAGLVKDNSTITLRNHTK